MKKLFKSLRARIFVVIFLAGFIPALVLHVIIVNTYESSLMDKRQIEIKQKLNMISAELCKYETIGESLSSEYSEILNWYAELYGGRILLIDRNSQIILDSYHADTNKTIVSDLVFSGFLGKESYNYNEETGFMEFVFPLFFSESTEREVIGVLIFSSTTEWIQDGLSRVEEAMLLIEVILLFILVLVDFYLSYLLVRPVKEISYRLERMQAGERTVDMKSVDSYSEVRSMLSSTSDLIDYYKRMEEQQKQFVSNVSHELRTPMASIRVLADSLIGSKDLPEEVYQEFLQDISVEIDRETRIIDDLLSMTKLEQANLLTVSTVNVNDFLSDILKTIRPIAEEKKVEVTYESFRKVTADFDVTKLTQAFLNLIENAIKYNKEGGFVKVSLDADHEYFYLRVEDSGIGIPEESLPHIFNRFYRVDKARSRETGGTGLGLSITQQMILLHHGTIKVQSKENEGTTFTVRIPLKQGDRANREEKKIEQKA